MSFVAGRIAGLDGLRALSVLAVFAHHTGLTTAHGGLIGVDVFFVLSGFLITRILGAEYGKTGRISLASFYLRRARRLYPALILFLAIAAGYCAVFQPQIDLAWEIGPALFYFMNWVRALGVYDAPMTGHTWSLAVEEQFYLVWPLVVLGMMHLRVVKPVVVVAFVALALAAWRIYLERNGASAARLYNGFDTHSDGLLVGAFIALAPPGIIRFMALLWKLSAAFLIVCILIQGAADFADSGAGFFIVALAAGSIIAKVFSDQGSVLVGVLSDKTLTWLGVVSYGFYLWHYAVIRVLLYSGHDQFGAFFGSLEYPRIAMFFACLVGSLVPTALSWYLLESPILKRANKEPTAPQRGAGASSAA